MFLIFCLKSEYNKIQRKVQMSLESQHAKPASIDRAAELNSLAALKRLHENGIGLGILYLIQHIKFNMTLILLEKKDPEMNLQEFSEPSMNVSSP